MVLQLLPRLDSWHQYIQNLRREDTCVRTWRLYKIEFYDGWMNIGYISWIIALLHPSQLDMWPQVESMNALHILHCDIDLNWTHLSWMCFCNTKAWTHVTQVHNRQILKNSSPHVNMCEIIGKCYRLSVHIYPDKNKHSLGSDTHFVQPKGEIHSGPHMSTYLER